MRNVMGPPVSGEDFFGRESERERLRKSLEDGNHVLLSAPRRVGKSSLVGQVCNDLKAKGWKVALIDVQHATDEVQFVDKIVKGLQAAGVAVPWSSQVEGWFKNLRRTLQGIKAVGVEIGPNDPTSWTDFADRISALLGEVAKKKEQLLVAIDELPIFLSFYLDKADDGPRRIANVLHWLRQARHAGNPWVRWIVCGSVGLDSFVVARGLAGTINDFKVETLGAFREAEALAFLQKLGTEHSDKLPLSNKACRLILDRIGWPLPYYLRLMFDALLNVRQETRNHARFPNEENVEAAIQHLLDPNRSVQFSYWDTRLDDQFARPDDAGVARFLLKRICKRTQGVARDDLHKDLAARQPNADPEALEGRLRDILELLERDGYLLRDGTNYAFRSFLLREYWERRFA